MENLGLSIKSTLTLGGVSFLHWKNDRVPSARKGECAPDQPPSAGGGGLSVTARAALAYSSLFSSNPSHCANVFLLSRHSRRPTFQSGPFSVRPPARLFVKHTADRSNQHRASIFARLNPFRRMTRHLFFFIPPLLFPSTSFPRSLLHFPCAVILRYNRRSFPLTR